MVSSNLIFNSTRGFGPFGHAARLVLIPKHRLTAGKQQRDVFAADLCQQRAGQFMTKPVFEDLIQPLIREKNQESSVILYPTGTNAEWTKLVVATIPHEVSRYNSFVRDEAIEEAVKKFTPSTGNFHVLVALDNPRQAVAAATAVARAFPQYTAKSSKKSSEIGDSTTPRTIDVEFLLPNEFPESSIDYAHIQLIVNGVRLASRLVDMPPNELNTTTYTEEINQIYEQRLKTHGVRMEVIKGHELRDRGFGGLWGVGKGNAEHPPALVILSHTPYNTPADSDIAKTMCWVGKGIVFDTGGLSIKGGVNMCTMKSDMGGSAAILAAFEAAVLACASSSSSSVSTSQTSVTTPKWNLHALLCLAENSVDAHSTRPDDILYMYSGKTVEINNTDAEGRLVLADGVAYATKHLNPDVVIDMATLTGAVLVTTGLKHAGVLSNDEALESAIVSAGKNSGDLMFPLLYAPEILLGTAKQFHSETADMKNSVKDRANAQSSCAGHFIEEHLVGDKWNWRKLIDGGDNDDDEESSGDGGDNGKKAQKQKGLWAHCDIAGTAWNGTRGTGRGVALLVELTRSLKI